MKTPTVFRRPVDYLCGLTSRFLLAIILVLGLLPTATAGAAKTYRAERFDVDLVIQTDGSLIVTETVVFRFEGGPFTYVFRELAFTELDDIQVVAVGLDGRTLPSGAGPGQVEIQVGRPLRVTWHLPPTSDATHTFTLTYRVQGAIRRLADADALIWRAIPEEHDYPIVASTITLRYPEAILLRDRPAVRGATAQIETGPGLVVATAKAIGENEDVVIEARFPAGSLITTPPRWQGLQVERQEQMRQAVPFGLVAALLTMVAGGGLLAQSRRRYPPLSAPPSIRGMTRTEPPSDLAPALAVRLADGPMPALAALFDLAQHGVLRIEETPSRWGRRFVLHRQDVVGPLRPHQEVLLEAMFRTRKGLEASAELIEAGRRLGTRQRAFNDALTAELIAAGLFDQARHAYSRRLQVITLMAMVLGVVVFILGMVVTGVTSANGDWTGLRPAVVMTGLGAGLFFVGFVGLILARVFSPRTPAGEELAVAWQRFGAYLKEVARGRQSLLRDELFETFLPYAAGFGLAGRWARRYTRQTGVPIPAWFSALRAEDSRGAFVAVMASSGSWGGGTGGGAGASGGGASGAG